MTATIFHCLERPPETAIQARIELLSPDERAKAATFRFERDRSNFVWRRIFRRLVLAKLVQRRPQDLSFSSRCGHCGGLDHGKPYLVELDGLEFSASHSGGACVVAVGDGPIGVDVETLSSDFEAVAEAALTPLEAEALERGAEDRTLWLGAMWVRKEAVLKAMGVGLAVEPSLVGVLAPGLTEGRFAPAQSPSRHSWNVASWRPGPDKVVALASADAPTVRWEAVAP